MIQTDNFFILVIFLILSIVVTILYYNKEVSSIGKKIKLFLVGLRSLTLFALLVLLLSPILKCSKNKELKPKTIFLIDNSKSISNYKFNQSLTEIISNLSSKIENNCEIETLVFDKDVMVFDSLNQKGLSTDILSSLNYVEDKNIESNLNRIILISDGNYNQGNHPIFFENKSLAKVDVLLVGDTTKVGDMMVEDIEYNPILISGESSQMNVLIRSVLMNQVKYAELKLEEVYNQSTKLLESKSVTMEGDRFAKSFTFKLSNLSKGKHHYRISINSSAKELNLKNNTKDFYVDVIDGTKQIEILSSFPHPDITAIKSILEQNKSFKVKLAISDSKLQFSDNADLLIFYQIPNMTENGKALFEKAKSMGKSVLFIMGSQVNYPQLNQLQQSYRVQVKANIMQDYFVRKNATFSKFYLQESTNSTMESLPPLSNYLLTIEPLREASHLFYARLGKIDVEQPLISFSNQDNMYIGILSGENIWKWKISNYQTKKNFNDIQDLLDKTVNYLAIKKDKKQLTVSISNPQVAENSRFLINANTYNELYQPVKASQIKCQIQGDNFEKTFDMISQENNYALSPQDLKKGNYTFKIQALIGNKKFDEQGEFTIYKENIEDYYIPANFEDMKSLAIKNNGEIFLLNEWMRLKNKLEKESYKSKIQTSLESLRANDIFFLLFTILLLISLEWLLRKYFGLS